MSAVQRGVWLRFIFFIFSLGSSGHPSLASAGPAGHTSRPGRGCPGAGREHPLEPVPVSPEPPAAPRLSSDTPRYKQQRSREAANPPLWPFPALGAGKLRLGDPKPRAPALARGRCGSEPQRGRARSPRRVKSLCPPPLPAGAQAAPARRLLRPGSGPVQGAQAPLGCRTRAAESVPCSPSPIPTSPSPRQAGVTLWLLLLALSLCLPRRPPQPGSPEEFGAPRRRMLRSGDGTAPSPHSRSSGERREGEAARHPRSYILSLWLSRILRNLLARAWH